MTFLPIAERELRQAARQKSTFWLRVVSALVATLLGAGLMLLSVMPATGLSTASIGQGLFATLTWLSMAPALLAGLFFTSDSLSQEKREGTFGFLFLTDLRGYDVVLGKLLATSLCGVGAFLAVFPILAITLMMGGVAGAQFWKTVLALVNALLVSLTAGLFVSALSRDAQKAMAGTFGLLVLLLAAGPLADALQAALTQTNHVPRWTLSSPAYPFLIAGAWGRAPFWTSLLVNQGMACLLLGAACLLAPRTWQDKPERRAGGRTNWRHAWKFGGAKRQDKLRRQLLERNPVWWLLCRERWQSGIIWAIALVQAVLFGAAFASGDEVFYAGWTWLSWLVNLVLYLGITSQAGRFLIEARQNGALELMLATPLTVKEIIRGQWRAMLRMFGWPLMACLTIQTVGAVLASSYLVADWQLAPVFNSLSDMLITLTNLIALTWVAIWGALKSKRPAMNTLRTIALVQVLPWLLISFGGGILVWLLFLNNVMTHLPWFPTFATTLLFLIKNFAFSWWAREKLRTHFRTRATQIANPIIPQVQPPPKPMPPPLPTHLPEGQR